MPSLHRDPAALRAVAAEIEALLPALRVPRLDPVDLAALGRAPGGPALVAEADRLGSAVGRTTRELAELATDLDAAVAAIERTEDLIVGVIAAAGR